MAKEYKETIKFIGLDGNKYIFKTMQNIVSSDQMWWIMPSHAMYAGTKREVKRVSKQIKKDCTIISITDTCGLFDETEYEDFIKETNNEN